MRAVAQPSGTVTLVFTDIEGSTRLLEELGTEAYREALAEHRRVVREACARFHGYEVDYEGDAFFYTFASAQEAVSAVAEAMVGLQPGPIRIRVGIHTGEPALDPPKYVGLDVHRAARIMSSAHGGQVVLSPSTVALLEPGSLRLKELGQHRLKDLSSPIPLHQLLIDGLREDFPPVKTLYRSNLPVPATPFLGRETELAEVVERLLDPDTRLLTLTGPGGTGKTRLALQAAAEAADEFPDGVFWVPLAPLRDPDLVLGAVVEALGVPAQPGVDPVAAVGAALEGRARLLVLDNVEHLLPGSLGPLGVLAGLVGPRLVVTSRERLGMQGERVFAVPPLARGEAVALLVARAADHGIGVRGDDPACEVLVERLDRLPLAVELAAARTGLFSVEQLVERLSERLDLLQGARDVDPRQQTLLATIDWSYRLLDAEEQRVHRALSVFAGGCTVEAAERVAGADPDVLQSLLDKSLLRRRDSALGPRLWQLETLRQHAADELDRTGEAETVKGRHIDWVEELAADAEQELKGGPGQVAAFGRIALELPNIRAGVDRALRAADPRALTIPTHLGLWWDVRDAATGRALLARAVAAYPDEPSLARAYAWASLYAIRVGDLDGARALAERGRDLALAHGDRWADAWALNNLAVAVSYGDSETRLDDGLGIWLDASLAAREAGDAWLVRTVAVNVLSTEAEIAGYRRTDPRCDQMGHPPGVAGLGSLLGQIRAAGDHVSAAAVLANLGWAHYVDEDWETALRCSLDAAALLDELGGFGRGVCLANAAHALIALDRVEEARTATNDALDVVMDMHRDPVLLAPIMLSATELLRRQGDSHQAAITEGAVSGLIGSFRVADSDIAMMEAIAERLRAELGVDAFDALRAQGRALPFREVLRDARAALTVAAPGAAADRGESPPPGR